MTRRRMLFLSDTFQHAGGISRSLWLGLSDAESEGNFTWTSGEQLTYTAWGSGEPSNCCGGENYVHMVPDVCGWPGGAQWNDLSE